MVGNIARFFIVARLCHLPRMESRFSSLLLSETETERNNSFEQERSFYSDIFNRARVAVRCNAGDGKVLWLARAPSRAQSEPGQSRVHFHHIFIIASERGYHRHIAITPHCFTLVFTVTQLACRMKIPSNRVRMSAQRAIKRGH